MPLFFFDISDADGRVHRDDEGLELASLDAAHLHALDEARGLITERVDPAQDWARWGIRICDAGRNLLLVVRFPEIFDRQAPGRAPPEAPP